ncbi:hypothetical protein SLNWT_2461 [Streptomyces albus]|uniref:Uncharacterized protein n=1 Tax=Streptomyces albus (strain ATCC 21838 / DSM 41398 / FERM P-419 / JCM 4703 / NBRC 107858) TaxID=1081613 RepID=A0A0B5EXL7_STRA4|nr:hypothetical protein SLNWT_2461 [Streptomyces albus]AOU77149.1 hypothetical protein SLNHY_2458 [Streptomyces albus]AYN32927.1 hypothetical protein DUI70_2425 [Streptomyces albus]
MVGVLRQYGLLRMVGPVNPSVETAGAEREGVSGCRMRERLVLRVHSPSPGVHARPPAP